MAAGKRLKRTSWCTGRGARRRWSVSISSEATCVRIRRASRSTSSCRASPTPRVYAAGDAAATAGAPLTPVASLEGAVVAANLLDGNRETPDYTGVPSAVFMIPELTRVGLEEAEASELINFFGLAMRTGLTASDLKKLVSAYPSAASDLGYLL